MRLSHLSQRLFTRYLCLSLLLLASLLLITAVIKLSTTASAAPDPKVNVALAANGGTATSSKVMSGQSPAFTIDGNRTGRDSASGANYLWWADNDSNIWPDEIEVQFNGEKTIDEINIIGVQENYLSATEPNLEMTSRFALRAFKVEYETPQGWATVPGGNVTCNTANDPLCNYKVWTHFGFSPITTDRLRITVNQVHNDNHTQIVEIEAYQATSCSPPPAGTNVALSSNGAIATGYPTTMAGQPASYAIDGNRKGRDEATNTNYMWWADDTSNVWPDSLTVEFPCEKTIGEIDVIGIQENYLSATEPTAEMTSRFALRAFELEYWTGSSWSTVPGGHVTCNTANDPSCNYKVWNKFTFTPLTTKKIRVTVNQVHNDNRTQIVEIEAYQASSGATPTPSPTPPQNTNNAFPNGRLEPRNRVGGSGEDLYSGNFNWGLPIVGLPGRAGLDLNLSLSYNSLVWSKGQSDQSILFDGDQGFPSPGFRLGFPVIQNNYYVNSQTQKNSFLMILPSGARVEFRQLGTSNMYEAADSSYMQLEVVNDTTMKVRSTDGTQLRFELKANNYQCVEIKDRNGNYISATYDSYGRIASITDTLARTINFNYQSDKLTSITQTRTNQQPFTWATFEYESLTIQSNFVKPDGSPLTITGIGNGQAVSVLKQVKLADLSSYRFSYTAWGQVYKIAHHATDGHLLSYTSYDLPLNTSTPLTDCPRFTTRRDWAENWNGDVADGVASSNEEAVTSFAGPATATWTLPGGGATDTGKVCEVITPDGTKTKVYYHGSGWDEGLPLWSETLVKNAQQQYEQQRWAITQWTQDDTAATYSLNPRVTETKVGDPSGNLRRTTIIYNAFTFADNSSCRLPVDVKEWEGANVLRHVQTDYILDTNYTSLRIIGLVKEVRLYAGAGTNDASLQSKVSYKYDESGSIASQAGIVHHDDNYDVNAPPHRGLLTSATRWDVTSAVDETKAVVTRMRYNTAGAVIEVTDPSGHKITVGYSDSFSESYSIPTTFAYPTLVRDAANQPTVFKFSYETGAVTSARDSLGAELVLAYDSIGRLQRRSLRDSVLNPNEDVTYTRFVYSPKQTEIRSYSSIDTGVESYSLQVMDGAGRIIGTASKHPGSTAGYSAQKQSYDVLGRLIAQTNPAEIANPETTAFNNWLPTGDDASTTGWKWTTQAYDWKGRPTVTTDTEGKTKQAVYEGCGCAGGEAVTLTDEVGRVQKAFMDVLGRLKRAEVYQDGTVYSTVVNTYNARDQLTNVREYQGLEASGIYQETLMTYDGHGRLATQHLPAQDTGKVTSYTYYPHDLLHTMTDARGAITTYTYTSRHQLENIFFAPPPNQEPPPAPQVADAADIGFEYDAAGNRTKMIDGTGNVVYIYDRLSRLASETRIITELVGTQKSSFTIAYDYTKSGQLKSITDPYNSTVNYTYDQAGRLQSVTGETPANGVINYANGAKYRAWGALKHLDYGNTATLDLDYNSRLEVSAMEVKTSPAGFNTFSAMKASYDYTDDGRVSFAHDMVHPLFNRAYRYDNVGRLKEALSGSEASGVNTPDGPYKQEFKFDVWNNMVERNNRFWTGGNAFTATYQNNRRQGLTYDADGREVGEASRQTSYDAAGQKILVTDTGISLQQSGLQTNVLTITQSYDGEGRSVRRTEIHTQGTTQTYNKTVFYIRSSVLGGAVLTEVHGNGEMISQRERTLVYGEGQLIARQTGASIETVTWMHSDPVTGTVTEIGSNGIVGERREYDPLGAEVGIEDPYQQYEEPDYLTVAGNDGPLYLLGGNPFSAEFGCVIDGMPVSCGELHDRIEIGTVVSEYVVNRSRTRGEPTLTQRGSSAHSVSGRVSWLWTERREIISYGLGLFGTLTPYDSRDSEGGYDWRNTVFSSNQTRTSQTTKETEIVKNALTKAGELLNKQKCIEFIEGGGTSGNPTLGLGKGAAGKIIGAINGVPHIFSGTGPIEGEVTTNEALYGLSLTFHNSFFKVPPPSVTSGGGTSKVQTSTTFSAINRSLENQAQILVHEGLHLLDPAYTDIDLANRIRGNKPLFTSRTKASKFLQDQVNKYCK